ncbi:transcriptional regulator, TetR family [Pseudomonas sp. NFPP07]|uniref:TetR/AcrR family transcriptional regulator n=1 Tax=Pseudomonas sp. NFPP07 TaxID=1566213 RepID=UPI0008EB15FE|nr:transcriptional regulator [Pseudomonas sp. NFPP07]SFQ28636.1 transcriptional regulator, TetR family [Pseudomonas sp. NFPP07]
MTPTSHDEHLLKTLTLAVVNRPRATMKELAQLVGVSKATLHRYCGTRENLGQRLEAYAEGTLERIIKSAGLQHAEPLDALRRLIREHLAHRELLAFLMAQYRPDFLDFEHGDARWQPYLEALDAFFLRGQQQGVFRIDITAAIFSELFITLIYGMVDAEQRGRAANANSAHTLEQMFLHGALCSGASSDACARAGNGASGLSASPQK